MTTFMVIKRMKEDRTYMPGETVVDIPRSDLLVQRGYLVIVPDDYEAKKAGAQAEADSRLSVQQALDLGYSEKAAKHIAARTDPLPKYVQEEKEKIDAKQERRAKRTQAELDRLAIVVGTTADEILDLDDEDYAKLLDENPSPAGTAASDASEVGDDHSKDKDLPPFETLMAMPKEGLLSNMADQSIPEPGIDGWYDNEDMRKAVVREILTAAGYSGAALEPQPTETDETKSE